MGLIKDILTKYCASAKRHIKVDVFILIQTNFPPTSHYVYLQDWACCTDAHKSDKMYYSLTEVLLSQQLQIVDIPLLSCMPAKRVASSQTS